VTIYTVGHSNRTLDTFLAILEAHGVRAIADVRRVPQSRRHPQFNRRALADALAREEIEYAWLEALGGRREPSADTPHTAVEAPFAGYAEHLRTAELARGADELFAMAARVPTAVMCAEAAFTDCHRRILSDWLVVHGHAVVHLRDAGRSAPHALSPEARVDPSGELVYDRGQQGRLI
jgi:uncharacterized protein (DUF488 family)